MSQWHNFEITHVETGSVHKETDYLLPSREYGFGASYTREEGKINIRLTPTQLSGPAFETDNKHGGVVKFRFKYLSSRKSDMDR